MNSLSFGSKSSNYSSKTMQQNTMGKKFKVRLTLKGLLKTNKTKKTKATYPQLVLCCHREEEEVVQSG